MSPITKAPTSTSAGNIGAAARALANMGFADLRLVAPDASADRMASDMAVHGREILLRATAYPELEAALQGRTLSIGTTCRPRRDRSGAQPLRAAIGELTAAEPQARVAFNLGEEPTTIRDRYGRTRFGQSCLLARRLIERGVRLVRINMFRSDEPRLVSLVMGPLAWPRAALSADNPRAVWLLAAPRLMCIAAAI